VPAMQTFDHYLDMKAKSIAVRTNNKLSSMTIVNILDIIGKLLR
jgi:hypothetical protein